MRSVNAIILYGLLMMCFVFSSCRKDVKQLKVEDHNSGIIVKSIDFDNCLKPQDFPLNNYVICDSNAYNDLLHYVDTGFQECVDFKLPDIDFSQFSLLGLYAIGKGCGVSFKRNVVRDDNQDLYIYTIKVEESGNCEMVRFDMNWVLVPKLPITHIVEFKVE